jgi:hypothetical protein
MKITAEQKKEWIKRIDDVISLYSGIYDEISDSLPGKENLTPYERGMDNLNLVFDTFNDAEREVKNLKED